MYVAVLLREPAPHVQFMQCHVYLSLDMFLASLSNIKRILNSVRYIAKNLPEDI